jgi:hypothetical protein
MLWQDSEELEKNQLHEYSTFEDQGLNAPTPEGHTKIPTHFMYDVKHDGRHKSRMVAGGHSTEMPVDSVYFGVVTLAGVRIVTFLSPNTTTWSYGARILAMHTSKATPKKRYASQLDQSSGSKKDTRSFYHKGTLRPPIKWSAMA